MSKVFTVLLLACFFVGPLSNAETTLSPSDPDELRAQVRRPRPPMRFEMTPQVSVIAISALSLPIPGYQVAYVPGIEGLPSFTLNLGRPFARLGSFTLGFNASIGYGSRTGQFSVSRIGAGLTDAERAPHGENLTLRWIPVTASVKASYQIPGISFLQPSLAVGFGNLALIQTSSVTALTRTLTIPLMVVSPQISFLDSNNFHWLGGFSFGATFLRGLAGDSKVSATSLDLSLNLLL